MILSCYFVIYFFLKQLATIAVIRSLGLIEIYVFFIKGPNIIFKKLKKGELR
jgi:uncharacterized membrane protein YobD (UPF0266 family)